MKEILIQLKTPTKYLLALLSILILITILVFSFESYQFSPSWFNKSAEDEKSNANDKNFLLKKVEVLAGDSWISIFQSLHLDLNLLQKILKLPEVQKYLMPLKIGQNLTFRIEKGELTSFETPLTQKENLVIENNQGLPTAKLEDLSIESSLTYTQGVIDGSFVKAAEKAGLTSKQMLELEKIFESKFDFSKALHSGDHFSALYQVDSLKNGQKVKGPLIAVKFYANNKIYTAIRFKDSRGTIHYYDERGNSLKPALLRIPLNYSRISSYFSRNRYHPILHVYRPHLGVDFAAPTGTPVKSVGEGRVIAIEKNNEVGKAIKVQYDKHIVSLYAHLSKFAKNLRVGKQINKGEVIGYVGSTGLSTGPHLHYSTYIDGKPENPLKIKLPGEKPVSSAEKEQFLEKARSMITLLELNEGPTLRSSID